MQLNHNTLTAHLLVRTSTAIHVAKQISFFLVKGTRGKKYKNGKRVMAIEGIEPPVGLEPTAF
jgi:hypothetical protein